MTGWPAWRTAPVTLGEAGFAPFVCGTLVAVVIVPLGTFSIEFVIQLVWQLLGQGPTGLPRGFSEFEGYLTLSPLFSWIFIAPANILAAVAARIGLAGWGVAVAGGGAMALWFWLALIVGTEGPWHWDEEQFALLGTGLLLGGSFWLGARLARPDLFRRAALGDAQNM